MPGTQPNLPGSAVALDVLWVFGGGNPFIGANTGASKATSASARDALRSRKAAFPWGVSKDAFVMGKKPLLPTTDNHTRFYDPSTDTWGSFSNMNEFRSSPSCAAIAGRMVLIDLSADFRVPNPRVFQQLNGFEHPSPELLSQFVYGLPEWNSAAIKGAKRIASPGCFATALQLALLPLRGLQIDFFAASAVTGSSGSGISPTFATHHPARANDFRAYKILTHHHTAEVEMAMAACNIDGTLGFVPHSGPFVRGIFATLQFGNGDGLHPSALPARAASAFDDCPFVRIVEGSPGVAAVAGTNFADVSVAANENTSAIMVALDNLGKGMAGQAVQAMNVALGLPETTALWQPARFPS
jgi:LysW-gamma-L-alpha-aminoadipyl-6-phosphate/LysW-L-glutamyl-5-phosphate reductase